MDLFWHHIPPDWSADKYPLGLRLWNAQIDPVVLFPLLGISSR
jgi:hypothetical protein